MSDTDAAIAGVIGEFASQVQFADIPVAVVDQSKLLILDALGIAYASTTYPFARSAVAAMHSLGQGDQPVIGLSLRLGLRDAAMLNGLLIHGLDYDDTHLAGVVHVSSTALPAALAVGAAPPPAGRDRMRG